MSFIYCVRNCLCISMHRMFRATQLLSSDNLRNVSFWIPSGLPSTETDRSSGWQPWYSLETLKTSFNVSSEYQSCQPDDCECIAGGPGSWLSKAVHDTIMSRLGWPHCMMTSSNGNIFRVTGHVCGEFTGPRWIPRIKASDAELLCFHCSASE